MRRVLPRDDAVFAAEFEEMGAAAMAQHYNTAVRAVYLHRQAVEKRTGRVITSPNSHLQRHTAMPIGPAMLRVDISDGVVIVGSDCHYWPGMVSTAHMAYLHLCRELKPKVVILNGDVMDGGRISRYALGQWLDYAHIPTVAQELDACKERLSEIESAAPRARRIWTLGNHDSRFETRLIAGAPEYAEVQGTQLKDHFPKWQPAWAAALNDEAVVKHRFKGGMYAPKNNALCAGRTMITGHLHAQQIIALTDYDGTRWGVDTGTMAEPFGEQFIHYTEANPVDWRSGLAVLTFYKGALMTPELVRVVDTGIVEFRGERIQVADPKKAGWPCLTTSPTSTQKSLRSYNGGQRPRKKSAKPKSGGTR